MMTKRKLAAVCFMMALVASSSMSLVRGYLPRRFAVKSLRGDVECALEAGPSMVGQMRGVLDCAWDEASWEFVETFRNKADEVARLRMPGDVRIRLGRFKVYDEELMGFTELYTLKVSVGLLGDFDKDFDTAVHEFKHRIAGLVLDDPELEGPYHETVDGAPCTAWYVARRGDDKCR